MTPCFESFHLGQFPCLWVVIYNVDCVCREFVEKMKVFTQFQTSAELERLQEGLLSESLSVYLSALMGGSLPSCLFSQLSYSASVTQWMSLQVYMLHNVWVNISLSLRLTESFSVSLRPASAVMRALAGCCMQVAWTEMESVLILLPMQVMTALCCLTLQILQTVSVLKICFVNLHCKTWTSQSKWWFKQMLEMANF